MNNLGWMIVAFGAVGAGIGSYVTYLLIRERSLRKRLEELRAR